MTIPYVYRIGWTKLNTWYIGVRHSKTCHPNDLWITYFTSSKHVRKFRELNGEPDHIEILKEFDNKKDACEFEEQKLREFDVLNKDNWLNKSISGYFYGEPFIKGKHHDEETKQKIREKHLGRKQTEEHKRKRAEARRGQKHSEESKQKMREKALGRKWSEEDKLKMSIARKGQSKPESMKIKIGNFHRGKTLSEETRQKIRDTLVGRKLSEETKQKIREKARLRKLAITKSLL